MEDDAISCDPGCGRRPVAAPAPALPPRNANPSDPAPEVWERWAAQLDLEPRDRRRRAAARRDARRRTYRRLLPTRGAAVIATAGWIGAVVAQLLLLAALVPSFDLGRTRHFVVPLDESPWFGATTVVAGSAAAIGWLWWTASAAFNVRRVSPLSTSPLLPLAVYLGGLVMVLAGLDGQGPTRTWLVALGSGWAGLGHVVVIGSFRGAAARIGALPDEFAKLLWLPLAGITYRLSVDVVLELMPAAWHSTPVLATLGALGGVFVWGMVLATWRATAAFDRACVRLNTRPLGAELPGVHRVGEALRRANGW